MQTLNGIKVSGVMAITIRTSMARVDLVRRRNMSLISSGSCWRADHTGLRDLSLDSGLVNEKELGCLELWKPVI